MATLHASDPPLLRIPDEITLHILRQLPSQRPKLRRQDLRNLTLVCKRIHPFALEMLLVEPTVHVFKAHGLLRMYFKYPNLADKVKSLELISECLCEDNPEIQACHYDLSQMKPANDVDFWISCFNVCTEFAPDCPALVNEHMECLETTEYPNAVLGVMLLRLRGLKHLFMGTTLLSHLSVLGPCVTPKDHILLGSDRFGSSLPVSNLWGAEFLERIYSRLAPNITQLELPYAWEGSRSTPMESAHDLSHFSSLTHLVVHQDALCDYDLGQALPRSLKLIAITARRSTADRLVSYLGSLLLHKPKLLPNLENIHLHHDWNDYVAGWYCRRPIRELEHDYIKKKLDRVAKVAALHGVQISIFHPKTDILHYTPWDPTYIVGDQEPEYGSMVLDVLDARRISFE
ncbi:hypothetical protein P280DRAFT_513219 [Massarina eburnea CBS 473.64]|uniref:Uncharacterized protein n=1 Tax=Massarina eburnea CBS 473.64 TaxID=1395130 RepID=A0A6A6SFV7_9PLEO|nr:hypothetical protein P280DRAFT_513219 [Massarina eburnea CBS 473.64]